MGVLRCELACRTSASAAFQLAPCTMTCAPSLSILARMYADVVSGTTTVHGLPRMRLAYAAAYPAQNPRDA